MIISHVYPPSLLAKPWVLHPDYKDKPIKSWSTYPIDQQYSDYCLLNNVIFYDVGYDYNLLKLRLDTFFDKELLQKIKNKEAILAIDQTVESFYYIVELIYKHLVIEQGIPAEQILLICHSYDMANKIKELAKELNQPELKCEYYNFWERQHKLTILRTMNDLGLHNFDRIDENRKSGLYGFTTKRYVNLNNTWREHRFALLCLLEGKNLIDKGYNSFSASPHKVGFSVPNQSTSPYIRYQSRPKLEQKEKEELDSKFKEWHTSVLNLFPKIKENLLQGYKVKDRLPLLLDTSDLALTLTWANQTYLLKYFKNTYFSIVTETCYMPEFPNDAPTAFLYNGNTAPNFITEKVFKPIGHKHPFIFVGMPNSLEVLKSWGYKTFDGLIDESYDKETDNSERLLKIVNETERLCKLTGEDLINFKTQCQSIVEHNFHLFMKRENYIKRLI